MLDSPNHPRNFLFLTVGLLAAGQSLGGCEVRPKPFVHVVEYRSGVACAPSPTDCPWAKLEREAAFTALVNCLLAGANVLEIEGDGRVRHRPVSEVVAPLAPRYGYERVGAAGDGASCPAERTVCTVASRYDREVTWATCGTQRLDETEMRGGENQAHADRLTESAVVTGSLAHAANDYPPPAGLDGPDDFYTFTLTERTRIEAAVVANQAIWSGVVGLVRSAWQPALHLLSSDGVRLQGGHVLRAGITAVFPSELEPGTYYLVVDSSTQEWKRGDGLYRLYVGFNQTLMGPVVPQGVTPAIPRRKGDAP